MATALLEPTAAPATALPSAVPLDPAPTPPPATRQPAATQTAAPSPSPTPTVKPTVKPTTKPSLPATPSPSPDPTAAPTLGPLSLSLAPCEGSFVIANWSKWLGSGFHHYQGLRSSSSSISPAWPPADGVTAPESLYSSTATTVSGVDTNLTAGTTAWYRMVAYDAASQPIAASVAVSVAIKPVKPLGLLSVSSDGPGSTSFAWTPYGGTSACFGYYKLVYSGTDPTPSYLDGDPHLWSSSAKSEASVTLDGIAAGTWWFRLQVLRGTPGGTQLVAQTDVATFTIP
jgi:hypothetical protein